MRDPDSGNEPMEESAKGSGVWQRVPQSLRLGVAVVAVAVVGVGVTLVAGYPFGMWSYMLTELALLCLAIGSVVELIRGQTPLWHSLGTCVVAVGLLYVVTPLGPASFMGLMDLRTRARVAMTGGQGQLQAWAVEVLARPRELMEQDGSGWLVPREQWSEQVRRLRPKVFLVRIDPLLEGGRNAVRLGYGGGPFHWYIVVGPAGSVPQRDSIDELWYRWGDGIYGWFPE